MARWAECKECGAPVRWEWTPDGRRMPLDPAPNPTLGTVTIGPQTGNALVRTKDDLAELRKRGAVDLYTSHWATCLDPRPFRRRQHAGSYTPQDD